MSKKPSAKITRQFCLLVGLISGDRELSNPSPETVRRVRNNHKLWAGKPKNRK